MAQRLAKIARELNVGISTIVEYLAEKGFTVESKPTAKITDEMHNALLEKYSLSKSIKEKADQSSLEQGYHLSLVTLHCLISVI